MKNEQPVFKRKQLVIAVSVAMLGVGLGGCSSSSDPVLPAAGIYTINAIGGDANNADTFEAGRGGNGGELYAYIEGGTGGVNVLATGKADTDFKSPVPNIKADTGSNPLVVDADAMVEAAELWDTPIADGDPVGFMSEYIGTDSVLRIDDGDSTADYALDAEVADDRLYTDGNELYTAATAAGANLAASGTLYTHTSDGNLPSDIYAADGDSATADAAYTGISVASGATLTLGLNYGGFAAYVGTSDDVENDGTITTDDQASPSTYRGSLGLRVHNYIASGTISTSGNATVVNAGTVDVSSAYATVNSGAINASGGDDGVNDGGDGAEVGLYSTGYIQNSGDINTSGANAAAGDGGYGGEINMEAAYVENSGDLTANGGNGATGFNGAYDGAIYLGADFGVNNSGDLTANGGNGDIGGSSYGVTLNTWSVGNTRNSGTITSRSGDGSVEHAGSSWDSVYIEASGGEVINSGDITTAGGSGVRSTSSSYGRGASINFSTDSGDANTPPDDVTVSGNLDTSGGDLSAAEGTSNWAGSAGQVSLYINIDGAEDGIAYHEVSGQKVTLLGYTNINTNGGNGYYAGSGYGVNLYTGAALDAESLDFKTGPIVNEVAISARGGDAIVVDEVSSSGARGGYGGSVYMQTAWDGARLNKGTDLSNSGDIDTSGGNSYNVTSTSYGRSGYINLFGYHGATNSGAITANGGDDTAADGGTNGRGGYAQSVNIDAEEGSVVNKGTISNNGGNGEYRGGYSNGVDLYGTKVDNSADLSSNGGNADATLANSSGGDGGHSELWGTSGFDAVKNSGTFSYSGGTGETEGDEGSVTVGLECEGNC